MPILRLLTFALAALLMLGAGNVALADGPSGSTECHIQDDDCDGQIDEDTGTASDDDDGDGLIDEDPPGDVDGDGDSDDDFDGSVDEDPADDDGDGQVDEDPPGDAADDPGENQVDCNEETSTDAGGLFFLYTAENGVETCADDSSDLPIDGRIIVTSDQGGYVAADGDNTNPAPSNGYVRIDGSGLHCGDENNQDSTADQAENTSEDCG